MFQSLLKRSFWALLLLAFLSQAAAAEVRLASVFSDNMVLQRQRDLPVWGWASPGETISVKLAEQTVSIRADKTGKWIVQLKPLDAGGPHVMSVKDASGEQLKIKNILVGEVWLCSGQSNMAMTVVRAANAKNEIAAGDHPQIRMFKTASPSAETPQEECKGAWQVCSPKTVGGFSATAYYFGKYLHEQLDVPIGLVNSSVGGTAVEAWTSLPALKEDASLAPILDRWDDRAAKYDPPAAQAAYEKALARWKVAAPKAKKAGKRTPRRPRPPIAPRKDRNHPSNLYNGMIRPLEPYALRGAIWYQGEHNSNFSSDLYGRLLSTLIADWRARWGQGDFPFYYVQLPNFRQPQTKPVEQTGWVLVREGMLDTLSQPNTGMAVTIDVGEAGDIHPKNKQTVGHRLALVALAKTYGKRIPYSGPSFTKMTKEEDSILLHFNHSDILKARGGGKITGFAIAGADKEFAFAEAELAGDGVLRISSSKVSMPVAVRYAWADNPTANLINGAGLPASPFRTDK